MMKTISIINLKGGVAKTISAINIAYTLVKVRGKKVLLIDNDKQGNTSKFFNLHNYEDKSLADLLTDRDCNIHSVIKRTAYEGLDIIPANMNLLQANKEILLDVARPQQTRLRKALSQLNDEYDYCIIDNAPDINMTVINALVATDDVLVPIKVDKFAFDGLEQLLDQIANVQEFNEKIVFKGCFITMYQRNGVNVQGNEYLASSTDYPLFHTVVRKTVKVDETTFVGRPLLDYKKSTAGQDYEKLVKEYLEMC
ncbi:ParA family protein [Lysinibacillus irui]|uniref:ParA family protein n=1 Tax=Lysinibacillus irui TaxID=2998077 RepID=A0ABU5NQI5_9BACI|nr:ParA family protein [Lysinibacillus irui]MEA0556051.1 ParA family protein [Lysinibacillus irui]MEA0978305.1 ParA family protein [Lysinibacillus irui]MEA1044459.1 ParA family protein [Lysinibacillus irui]